MGKSSIYQTIEHINVLYSQGAFIFFKWNHYFCQTVVSFNKNWMMILMEQRNDHWNFSLNLRSFKTPIMIQFQI